MSAGEPPRALVAGIGNIFLGDDGFGVEAVKAIDPASLPPYVDVGDYGIRGVHLAFELLDGRYDTLVMLDAVALGEPAGTLAVIDVSEYATRAEFSSYAGNSVDAHSMHPEAVLAALHNLGGSLDRVLVIGCQPGTLTEGMGLSAPVAAAVAGAVGLVHEVLEKRAEKTRGAKFGASDRGQQAAAPVTGTEGASVT